MKFRSIARASFAVLALIPFLIAGCSSSSPNQTVVTVLPVGVTVLPGQVVSLTATVTGNETTTVTWSCSAKITTTSTDSTGKVTSTSTTEPCNPDSPGYPKYGTITGTNTNVVSYTAPSLSSFPNPIPVITLTATSTAETKKTGTSTIVLDSGIRASITPATATVPVGLKPNQVVQFTASLLNDPGTDVTWLVTQPVPESKTNSSASNTSPTCSPTCGTISASGLFTAPDTMPTATFPETSKTASPASVTVVMYSNVDPTRYAISSITLINATTNPITFSGITPTSAPAGGVEQDIFLNAKNLVNTTTVSFTPPGGAAQPLPPSQIQTIPITTAYCKPSASGVTPVVTCDSSIVTRVRLLSNQLTYPGQALLSVSGIPDSENSGQTKTVSYPLQLFNTHPALLSTSPDSFHQGLSVDMLADGGYYGTCSNIIVKLLFDGNLNAAYCPSQGSIASGPRQMIAPLDGAQLLSPGLYPVTAVSNAQSNAPTFPSATGNIAVQPSFATLIPATPPTAPCTPAGQSPSGTQNFPPCFILPGPSTNLPSSMAINSSKSYAVLVNQGSNTIQYVDYSTGIPTFAIAPFAVGNAPTSVAIDNLINLSIPDDPGGVHDMAVVVNSADSTISLIAIPTPGYPHFTNVGTVQLAGLLQAPSGTSSAPTPFSVGVDPYTHLGVVAYSGTNAGFVLNLNPAAGSDPTDPLKTCFLTTETTPCAVSAVTLTSGPTPQVIVQPQSTNAFVTPGGVGILSVVNLAQPGKNANISLTPNGAVRTNGTVTVKTVTPHGINPSTGGTVLIAGLDKSDMDGSFAVTSVVDPYTFTYYQSNFSDAQYNETGGSPTGADATPPTASWATVRFGYPSLTFNISNTIVGGAINPVTRVTAFADPNASGTTGGVSPQIYLLNSMDQTVSSITLRRGSYEGNPTTAPESGIRYVSWDPFTNVLIALNPEVNEISLIDPVGTTNTAPNRIVPPIPTDQIAKGQYTPSGTTSPVTVFGALAYDPLKHLVFVANAGSNSLSVLDVDPPPSTFTPVQIIAVNILSGGVPNAQRPLNTDGSTKPGALTCDPALPAGTSYMPQAVCMNVSNASVQVLGKGFLPGASQVRLDGQLVPTTFVSPTELHAAIPASMLTLPHDYALDVQVNGTSGPQNSNSMDLQVVGVVDLTSSSCTTNPKPEGVAIDSTRNIAIVTLFGCSTGAVSVVSIDQNNAHGYNQAYGSVLSTLAVGKGPVGVDTIPRLGYAVVSNNGDNTASVLDISNPLAPKAAAPAVAIGISPTGVAISQDYAYALIANSGSNTVSLIDLTALIAATPGTLTEVPIAVDGQPRAIAIDPVREIAVVTAVLQQSVNAVLGALDVITLAGSPARNSSASLTSLSSLPTAVVNDPAVSPSIFYSTSPTQNAVYAFNPNTGAASQLRVGVNPYTIALNPQTATLVSINSTSNSMSIMDTLTFRTKATLGIGSQSIFAVTMDTVNNVALIADQNNNRLLMVAMPH